jgi:Ran GTPase-activating protein (RanGAP) involved in mRNA processing and transport
MPSNSKSSILNFIELGNPQIENISEAIKKSSTLKILDLNNNYIGDQGIKYISDALQYNKNIEVINLSSNDIGDEGAYLISKLLINNSIKIGDPNSQNNFYNNIYLI